MTRPGDLVARSGPASVLDAAHADHRSMARRVQPSGMARADHEDMFTRSTAVAFVASTLAFGVWGVADAAPKKQTPAPEKAPAEPTEASQDLREWRVAWDQLTAEQRQALVAAGKGAIAETQSLTPEQRASLERGLDALAADPTAKYQELGPTQQQAVKDALSDLRAAYMDLTAEQKAGFLAQLAGAITQGPPQPGAPGMEPGTPPSGAPPGTE